MLSHVKQTLHFPKELCMVQEALRLYPVAPSTDRVAQRDMYIGGHFIPKGTSLWILIYAIQHSSEHWDDPEAFNPVSCVCASIPLF